MTHLKTHRNDNIAPEVMDKLTPEMKAKLLGGLPNPKRAKLK